MSNSPGPSPQYDAFSQRVKTLLTVLYGPDDAEQLVDRLFALIKDRLHDVTSENLQKWTADNILLITYGDSIQDPQDAVPLTSLSRFLEKFLQDTVTGVHLLPFFPFSSDDGFAVIDYLAVNPALGTWAEVAKIANQFDLMVDLVMNHVSSQSLWFQQFRAGESPGCHYFVEVPPETDVTDVVRPRSTPLLVPIDTVAGSKFVWATFGPDQIDLDFSNPDVLEEFIKILLFYVQAGAKYIRLDAIGYLWKRLGTPCIHLRETHAMVRLLREILQMLDPSITLITETNVPNRENLSYFGNRNEAHVIYNFSLPPLILNALLQGRADHLKTWMMSMPPAPLGCAYLNFTASHDGIGLRPAEGLLSSDEYETLLRCMRRFGGAISMRQQPDGSESPYEVNISFFDALKGTAEGEDQWQIERFLCSQTIMMSLEGIPAFYIHSLLATANDWEAVERTGRKRSINRHQWDYEQLQRHLADGPSPHAVVFKELCRLIRLRRKQGAFHPNATQYTLHLHNQSLFAFWRQSMARDQSIFSIHNLSNRPQPLQLSDLNLVSTDAWCDLIDGVCLPDLYGRLSLRPYQSVWVTNKFDPLQFPGQVNNTEEAF